MLTTLAQRSRQYVVLGLALYWILIFTLTHVPTSGLPPTDTNDKVAHLLAYFVLGALLYSAIAIRRPSQVAIGTIVLLIAAIYGAIDEQTQKFVGRHCDLHDWLADMTGALIGVALMIVLRRIKPFRAPASE
jgi:VanZ family protein